MSAPLLPPTPPTPVSKPHLAVALAVWAISTFGHKVGLDIAGKVFQFARDGNNFLSEEGGPVGMWRLELILGTFFGAIALGVLVQLGRKIHALQPSRADLQREVVPWLIWATLTYLVWKCFIVYATEMTHFAQYALVGFLVAYALGRGSRPQLAFLITVGLGFTDELYQHYVLAWGHKTHFMDWSDPVLDALGACGGILPFVTLTRLRGETPPVTFHYVKRTVLGAAVVLLPLLLLSPVTTSWVLGHYHYDPFWGEFRNDKPTHWPGPWEGIPLDLAALVVLGTLMEPRRRPLSQTSLALLLVLAVVAIRPPSRERGMPIHEEVPRAIVQRAPARIVVDGVLEEAWEKAPRLGPFVRNEDGKRAQQATYARVLWDAERLYVAFEVTDVDAWTEDRERDDRWITNDEHVILLLDDGGDEITYFSVAISPQNAVHDGYAFVPRSPVEHDPSTPVRIMTGWDARGMETAVTFEGTLDVVANYEAPATFDPDKGWVAEVALPWSAIAPYPASKVDHRPVPPRAGDVWRLGLFRYDHPRVPPDAPEGTVPSTYREKQREMQAWSPTWTPTFVYSPRWFGALEFAE